MQITETFAIDIDKDLVKWVLDQHYSPITGGGPFWLTFLGHTKDSLWSIDFFRCETILLNSYWVLVAMDQFTRRNIGFGVHAGDVEGVALCYMFNRAISNPGAPHYLSSDNDPLFRYRRWKANLRVLEIDEAKSIPYTPQLHPFVERLIGTIRGEYLDHLFFWIAGDLERELASFANYYNRKRVHHSLGGASPEVASGEPRNPRAPIGDYSWQHYCNGLFQFPVAA